VSLLADEHLPAPTFPFTRDGFERVLVRQIGWVCLVARTNRVTGSRHWEVVILQHERAKAIRGCPYPEHLRYPGTRQWGEAGWTYTTRAEAERRFAALTARNEKA
jgi:hypothetical protein